ncbi:MULTISPECIES: exodeoxyribonuclease VII large subunit [Desulfitobacterium]|uniref:Exodeoxyribonuclease 7 large subunit n=2 Tax=Desulfitobacterium dehalogenans TaxID=36854 RepID=I4AB92_DESDJ|nr:MULTISPECIES: exodeoxyribonuclease VII large subunit [Desulfitobacterium]AFM01227.1 Exodeoxyribonuclease VII large subunit [Desulfitobacterium dehalogenans ATCC 51507]HHY26967.1 exodeoxyribonuclease VII large subunit [Desulfitobacterium dehalogenans]
MPKIWTVAELTREIGQTLNDNPDFINCWVSGEISNYKNHRPSGHWYFTLKDEHSSIKGVMFRSRAERVRFTPQDGMKILVRGSIRIYERDGTIQLYAEEMQPSGVGALYLAFEQLKERLAQEGLFAPERKKAIPRYPRRIGIVTSPTGAAIKDILKVMFRRNPQISWILAPAAVQGELAPREVAQAIARLNRHSQVDVIIVGRGGGSLEELWAFNTEEVARAIAASGIPVISAVGHETDVTIADMVADLRAPTPSAAAELAVPVWLELKTDLEQLKSRLHSAMNSQLQRKRQRLDSLKGIGPLSNPFWRIDQNRQRLDSLSERMEQGMTRFVSDKNGILKLLTAKLDLLSPLAILGRGYSLTYGPKGNVLRRSEDINVGQQVQVRLQEGILTCAVLAKSVDSN